MKKSSFLILSSDFCSDFIEILSEFNFADILKMLKIKISDFLYFLTKIPKFCSEVRKAENEDGKRK